MEVTQGLIEMVKKYYSDVDEAYSFNGYIWVTFMQVVRVYLRLDLHHTDSATITDFERASRLGEKLNLN